MRILRFPDLVARGLFQSRMTLKRAIDGQGFPPGILITPNSRAWYESEVEAWIASRPVARKADPRGTYDLRPLRAANKRKIYEGSTLRGRVYQTDTGWVAEGRDGRALGAFQSPRFALRAIFAAQAA
jgi:predicted DNA-binding transcriptional regulator AlpA